MSNVARTTVVVMGITMLSKILGFIRETVLVSVHGAGAISDAYITSMSIPGILFATIATALVTCFIPLYFEVKRDQGDDIAQKFANNVFNIVIIISMVVCVVGFIFAKQLTSLFAMSFTGEKLELATNFTRIMIFGMFFIALSNIMTCWLQIKDSFKVSAMASIPFNLIIIISIILSQERNINIMAIGTILAMASQFIFQLPFALKKGLKYKIYINLNDKYIKRILYLLVPVIIGVGVNQINLVIDRSLASSLGDGIIAVMNSANKLNGFVISLFITSIAVVIYPSLAKLSMDGDKSKFKEIIVKSINIITILIIPISVGAIVLSKPVVSLVFERGKFDSQATILTSQALAFYSLGMIAYGFREILNRVFYAIKDTRTPMINGGLSMIINILLNIVLIKYMGHVGLALGTSLSGIICILLLFRSLKTKIGSYGGKKILSTILKSSIAAFVMGILTYKTYDLVSLNLGYGTINEILSLVIAVTIGACVYSFMVIMLKIEEVSTIFNLIKNKLNIKMKNSIDTD